MKDYIEMEIYNDHYIHQDRKTKSFVVFGVIRNGCYIDLTFASERTILYTADTLPKMRKKIEKSGIRRKPRRH